MIAWVSQVKSCNHKESVVTQRLTLNARIIYVSVQNMRELKTPTYTKEMLQCTGPTQQRLPLNILDTHPISQASFSNAGLRQIELLECRFFMR